MPTRSHFALVLVLALGFAGLSSCGREPVRIANVAGIDDALSARRGKACLVNFWATWCPPCVAELPELVAVGREFEASGGCVLGVSFDLMQPKDLPEPTLAKVRQFLAQRELAFETLICERAELGKLIERFDLPDGIPITHAYDAQGKLVDQHLGQADRARFAEMMQKALGR